MRPVGNGAVAVSTAGSSSRSYSLFRQELLARMEGLGEEVERVRGEPRGPWMVP